MRNIVKSVLLEANVPGVNLATTPKEGNARVVGIIATPATVKMMKDVRDVKVVTISILMEFARVVGIIVISTSARTGKAVKDVNMGTTWTTHLVNHASATVI